MIKLKCIVDFYKMHHNDLINYKASQSVKLLQVCRNPDYLYQIVVNKELKLIKTDQNKIKILS